MARGKSQFFDSDSRSKPAPKNADVKRSREVPEGDSRFKPAQKSADLQRPRALREAEAHSKPVQKRSRANPLSAADLQLWAAYSQTLSSLMPGKTRLPVGAEPPPPAAP